MLTPVYRFLKQENVIHLKLFIFILMSHMPENIDLRSNNYIPPSHLLSPELYNSSKFRSPLQTLSLDGHLSFKNNQHAAKDFGNIYHYPPLAVLHPKSVSDISAMIKLVFEMGSGSELTIAARGHGHSLEGQAQAHRGVVINMESLKEQEISVHGGEYPFADVSSGELWIDILHETLRYGLAPKSWTDYLHLTVGGTLSNAGISGQAFRHGPQISNVHQLEVVTGKGDIVTCSESQNPDLFNAVLGGLGQFGVITRARISLEQATKMVKWIRVLYSDFSSFTKDQESLISTQHSFDYIEGFVIINRTGLLNTWRSSFDPKDPIRASQFSSDGRILYCLEMGMYFDSYNKDTANKKIDRLLSELSYIPSTLFLSEVTYVDFLNRVQISQAKLQAQGLWDLPHPWMNLLIPKSKINKFAKAVFGNILKYTSNGPILIYPVNKSKWNKKTSLVTPDEDIIYLVAFLSSASPSSVGNDGLEHILSQNQKILDYCAKARIGTKQYLPHYTRIEEWREHFGLKWPEFVQRKSAYDPMAILAPGHRIFKKGTQLS